MDYVVSLIPAVASVLSTVLGVIICIRKCKKTFEKSESAKLIEEMKIQNAVSTKIHKRLMELSEENKELHEDIEFLRSQVKGLMQNEKHKN